MQIEPIGRVSGRLLLTAPSLEEGAAELAWAFAARGLEVSVAATGQEALPQAEATRFDLVICDLALPLGSGLDLLNALRDREVVGPGVSELRRTPDWAKAVVAAAIRIRDSACTIPTRPERRSAGPEGNDLRGVIGP